MSIHQQSFLQEKLQQSYAQVNAVIVPTFIEAAAQFIATLKRKEMSKETQRGYQVDLKQFNKFLLGENNTPVFVNQITEDKMEQFVDTLRKKNLAPASINRKINAISSFCNFTVKKRWLAYNPVADIDRVKGKSQPRTFLNANEMQKLIAAIKHPIAKHVAILMSNTGLRISEAVHLKLEDVDLQKKVVHVIEGKGGKDRDVPMSDALVQKMDTYLASVRPKGIESLFFFATSKTGMISQQYVNRILREACEEAGLQKDVTSHVLRHSFASQLVKTNAHVSTIQHALGHADVRTTSIYMHAELQDIADAVNTIAFLQERE